MVTRTEQLKALAEAATPATDGGVLAVDWHAYRIEATPQVVKAPCELVEHAAAALKAERAFGGCTFYVDKRNEALAAFERFQKGE